MEKESIKKEIKKSYGNIAKENIQAGCCSAKGGCCGTDESSTAMAEEYSSLQGYIKDADLSLGCGLPTEIAKINEGDTVVDLGSGAGNDAFIVRRTVGEKGRVIGIDMTPEMVIKALQNNQKLGYKNVEFMLGEIENMQDLPDSVADVVISNCVMNLVPNQDKAFREIFRILKTGGHFSISDIVSIGSLPKGILEAVELYSGCVAGASEKSQYLGIIKSAGFKNIQIKEERKIEVSDDLLLKYISSEELEDYKLSGSGVYSITVYADKLEEGSCCEITESGCCGSEEKAAKAQSSCCGTESSGETKCC